MTFALSINSSQAEIVGAINYLIGTQPGVNAVSVNVQTGAIVNPYTQTNLGYTYQYLFAAYGTSITGDNFSFSPTNATYVGLRNSSDGVTVSTNPADYIWKAADPVFGTTNFLFYTSIGGRQIQFTIDTSPPSSAYLPMPIGGSVNLDIVTVAGTSSNTVFANTALTVINNVQSNITQVGTLTRLSVSGNINAGNVIANTRIISSNTISASNAVTAGNNISSGNTIFASYSVTAGNFVYAYDHVTAGNNLISINAQFSGNVNIGGNTRANGNVTVDGFVVSNANVRGNIVKVGTQATHWSIYNTPTNGLLFQFGGANLMVLNTNGNLIVAGNVIQNGTVT